jgi:threonine dehydrogenase-like Zn-dependent dehydrogenase
VKALVYLGPRRMELQDVPEPELGEGDARVRVTAAAICGSDLHGFREASPRRIPPLVMGHEGVGVVDELGPGSDPALEGRRVVAIPVVPCGACARCAEGRPNLCPSRRLMGMHFPGAFAEAFAIPASQLLVVPDELDDVTASVAEPFANGLCAAGRAVSPGDVVLVIGAGVIGLFAARAAVLSGAARVLVTDRLESRLALVPALDAEPVPTERAAELTGDASGGIGADVVIDAVGVPATWALALNAVRFGGRVEAVGLGAVEGPVPYQTLVAKGITVAGSYACVPSDLDRALAHLERRDIDVAGWIATMPLADGQRAFEALVDEDRYTKVVLTP